MTVTEARVSQQTDVYGAIPQKGRRNLENTPELFPRLSHEGCEFLHEVDRVAFFLEQQLSFYLMLKNRTSLYTPLPVQRVVDVAERLVCMPEVNPPNRDYFLIRVIKDEVLTHEGGKTYNKLNGVEMSFFSHGSRNDPDVQVSIWPNTIRKTFAADGKPIAYLSGLTQVEVEDIMAYRGKSPEEILQIAETHQETYPTFKITSRGARFQMVFLNGIVHCELSIEGINYGQQACDLQLPDEEVDSPVGIKDKYTTSVSMTIPLKKFRRFKGHSHISQEEIDRWLNAIASDMAEKAKPTKPK